METTVEVSDPSAVAEVRRAVALLGHSVGLSTEFVAQVALVTTELCTNILKYAGTGTVTLATHSSEGVMGGVDIVAIDKGPGIPNFESSSRDGHSTGGSLGLGLGAIRRAATHIDVYTAAGAGTALLVRMADRRQAALAPPAFTLGAKMVPMRGEHVCGDAWAAVRFGRFLAVTVVDGLGHGPKAAHAAHAALDSFHHCIHAVGPAEAVKLAHQALQPTRGAVMAVAVIDPSEGTLRYAGIGNIAGVVLGEDTPVRLVSSDGTVGFGTRVPRESLHAWGPRSTLILNSDGLSSRWNLNAHPGLLGRHPTLIASVLHRDFSRNTDDATVLVVKNTSC